MSKRVGESSSQPGGHGAASAEVESPRTQKRRLMEMEQGGSSASLGAAAAVAAEDGGDGDEGAFVGGRVVLP